MRVITFTDFRAWKKLFSEMSRKLFYTRGDVVSSFSYALSASKKCTSSPRLI